MKIFLRQVLFEQLKRENVMNCFLLCDSWSSNRNDDIFYEIAIEFPEIKVKRKLIPLSTTGTTQLFDVLFSTT